MSNNSGCSKVDLAVKFTEAVEQLETAVETAVNSLPSLVFRASPAMLAAKQLISNLKVNSRRFIIAKITQI